MGFSLPTGFTTIGSQVLKNSSAEKLLAYRPPDLAVSQVEQLWQCTRMVKILMRLPVVKRQQASQPLAHLDFASGCTDSVLWPRKKNHIPFALVISFTMKMENVI
jgi:hypothetical protein